MRIFLIAFILLFSSTAYALDKCPETPDTAITWKKFDEGDLFYDSYEDQIIVSSRFMRRFSKKAQDMLLLHECGHAKKMLFERDADEYSLIKGHELGLIDLETVEEISNALKNRLNSPRRAKWILERYKEIAGEPQQTITIEPDTEE